MLNRFSSRKTDLGKSFLVERLKGAVAYDRIAGYFSSSCLEIAGEAVENVSGTVRVICNSGITAEDVKIAGLAEHRQKIEWTALRPEERFVSAAECARLQRLYDLLKSGKMVIRVVPDEVYGLLHGKAGVITYADGRRTSFIGSMNETKSALSSNYEIVWEDDDAASADWVQREFDFFWNNPAAVPLAEAVIEDVRRIAKRHPLKVDEWKKEALEQPEAAVAAVAAEEPVFREEFGLWAHQKYFVLRAFREHQQKGGARLVLADMVGLGKTLQLAMTAKLVALTGEKPILVIVPKTLLLQWQEELKDKLDVPSAIWNGKCWVDENGFEYAVSGAQDILNCPRRIGIVSQGLITARTEAADRLLDMHGGYDLVILDEAHRARRRNLSQDPNKNKAQPNNLLRFMTTISDKTRSMLLATATPVQLKAIEAFDLLMALGVPDEATKVLGDKFSVWRTQPQTGLDYVSGALEPPRGDALMWEIVRNPIPLCDDHEIASLRNKLDLADETSVLSQGAFEHLPRPVQGDIRELYREDGFVSRFNPYVRTIVRRTRDYLENTVNPETGLPYLEKIEVDLYGEKSEESLPLQGYLAEAYRIAESFCEMLSKRVKGGGFMSTMLLKRIGSTMLAGENTAKKFCQWVNETEDQGTAFYDISAEDDDDGTDGEDGADVSHELKELTKEELQTLRRLIDVLAQNKDTDPKMKRIVEILKNGVSGSGPWIQKGCILFSQYFDSARYVAENLSREFPGLPVGLYAGGDKSGLFTDGAFVAMDKNGLKAMVCDGRLKLLVGTDAASEGLNLQRLGTLINIDLPWNPTRLEQRKGRIQRIGQLAKRISIYNLRYAGSVEDRVHATLSDRLREIHDIFGQLPEVLEDVWVLVAQKEEAKALERINAIAAKNPFVVKYEQSIPPMSDWEKCERVLDRREKLRELAKGW